MAAQVDDLLERLKKEQAYNTVQRNNYTAVKSAADLMIEAETVGRFQNPKFVIDKNNRFAYENIAKWFVGDETMLCDGRDRLSHPADLTKGIYLAGPTGTGKTTAFSIFGYLARTYGMKFVFRGESKNLSFATYNADTIAEIFTSGGDITGITNTDVLLINELGAEPADSMYMGNRIDPIRRILDRRGDMHGKITFITSNHPIMSPALAERYGDRVVSRLYGMCNYLELRGEDRRK